LPRLDIFPVVVDVTFCGWYVTSIRRYVTSIRRHLTSILTACSTPYCLII
jgi:hypothetical protein